MVVSKLDVANERIGTVSVLRARGRVDFATEADFSHALDRLIVPHARILLDLENVDCINSVGLGIIIRCHKRLENAFGSLAVLCTRPNLLHAFQVLNFHTVLRLVTSQEEGLQALEAAS